MLSPDVDEGQVKDIIGFKGDAQHIQNSIIAGQLFMSGKQLAEAVTLSEINGQTNIRFGKLEDYENLSKENRMSALTDFFSQKNHNCLVHLPDDCRVSLIDKYKDKLDSVVGKVQPIGWFFISNGREELINGGLASCCQIKLEGKDFENLDFSKTCFKGAFFTNVNLKGVKFQNTFLDSATIKGKTNLQAEQLKYANFTAVFADPENAKIVLKAMNLREKILVEPINSLLKYISEGGENIKKEISTYPNVFVKFFDYLQKSTEQQSVNYKNSI